MKTQDRAKRRLKIKSRIRGKVSGTAEKPRLSIVKSVRHIYAQMIDDEKMVTIAATSTLSKDLAEKIKGKNKTAAAEIVGEAIAKLAVEKGVETIAFDRNGNRYHGRVKALAEAARKAGLKF
ncbi:MAG: 50S ribosomal protein L18 [Candidatus Zixiibacteriota bacterium]